MILIDDDNVYMMRRGPNSQRPTARHGPQRYYANVQYANKYWLLWRWKPYFEGSKAALRVVIFFFVLTTWPPGAFHYQLLIWFRSAIGHETRSAMRALVLSLTTSFFFYSTFLLLRHNFSPAIIFVWCCWHLVTTSNEKCTTCCPLNLLTYERLEGEIGTFTFLIFS